jgi:hypothetical protein
MKKVLIPIVLIIFGIMVFLVIINLIDSKRGERRFNINQLHPASMDYENGFYRFLLLGLPPHEDFDSMEKLNYIKEFSVSGKLTEKWLKKYINFYRDQRRKEKPWRKFRIPFPRTYNQNWIKIIRNQKVRIKNKISSYSYFLDRYERLVNSEKISDFTPPRLYTLIPDLELWGNICKLYLADKILHYLEKKDIEIVKKILNHFTFTLRILKTARSIDLNTTSKKLAGLNLHLINNLLNDISIPVDCINYISDYLESINIFDYSSRNSLIFEALVMEDFIQAVSSLKKINPFSRIKLTENRYEYHLYRNRTKIQLGKVLLNGFVQLTLQKNRTLDEIEFQVENLLSFEMQNPCDWKVDPTQLSKMVKKNPLWWLQNAAGKFLLYNNLNTYFIFDTHELRCKFSLTKILSKIRKHRVNQSGEIKKIIISFTDPFSGKPYIYSPDKAIIYSCGLNCMDNGGVQKVRSTESDIPISLTFLPVLAARKQVPRDSYAQTFQTSHRIDSTWSVDLA